MLEILDAFAAQVRVRPNEIATAHHDQSLTFEGLDAATDRLAHLLHERRQGENDVVGYLNTVGIETIQLNLATLKAGQCVIALDPGHPVAALAELVQHSGMGVITAPAQHLELARQLIGDAVIEIPADTPDRTAIPVFEPVDCPSDIFANVSYTSGSSGKPKGAVASRALLTEKWRRSRICEFTPDDIAACFINFRWEDQLRPVTDGATLQWFNLGQMGAQVLVDWISEKQVTNITSYKGIFRQLIDSNVAAFPHIKRYFVIGEPLLRADLEAVNQKFAPGSRVYCRYGSQEYGTMTLCEYRHGDPIAHDMVPLGRPLEPDYFMLLDEDGHEVPEGEPGEIVMSSPLVAHGYLHDPARSAEVFKPDPNRFGSWRYHTGDLAQLAPDQMLHGLGRKDLQVKIRGFNVRPPEVEEVIMRHPGVKMAAVAPFEGKSGIRQLACHIIPASGAGPTAAEMRAYMRERVPGYMVPAVYLTHSSLPLTDNGKILRRALPDPTGQMGENNRELSVASTTSERNLAQIWTHILGHSGFDSSDDFFALGGDSLQAMAMLTAIEAKFRVKVPLESLTLDGASISVLAERLDGAGTQGADNTPVLIKRGKGNGALYAAHVIGGHLSDYLDMLAGFLADRPIYGLHPKGMDGRDVPDMSFETQARHCAAAIRRHRPNGPYNVIGYSYGAKLAYEIARELTQQGALVDHLIMIDPTRPDSDRLARLKTIYYPLRDGPWSLAWKRLTVTVPASLGLRPPPQWIDEAHVAANISYKAKPLSLPRVLVVQAETTPNGAVVRREWQARLGGVITFDSATGDHLTMVRPPNGVSLARKIETWMANAQTG